MNEVVAGREPAADVGVDDVRDRNTEILLPLRQRQRLSSTYAACTEVEARPRLGSVQTVRLNSSGVSSTQKVGAILSPVSTGMGDRLPAGIPPRYETSQPGQISLLPSLGWEMSTGQSAVMLCS